MELRKELFTDLQARSESDDQRDVLFQPVWHTKFKVLNDRAAQ